MAQVCGKCGSKYVVCPECGDDYLHGEWTHCPRPPCEAINAPLDCDGCGFVVARNGRGVLDHDMNLIPYREEA